MFLLPVYDDEENSELLVSAKSPLFISTESPVLFPNIAGALLVHTVYISTYILFLMLGVCLRTV